MRTLTRFILILLALAPGSALFAASFYVATYGTHLVLNDGTSVWGWYLGMGVVLTLLGGILVGASGLFDLR